MSNLLNCVFNTTSLVFRSAISSCGLLRSVRILKSSMRLASAIYKNCLTGGASWPSLNLVACLLPVVPTQDISGPGKSLHRRYVHVALPQMHSYNN
jgi:hypothetical protein